MNTSSFNLVTPCFFRANGVHCEDGILVYSGPEYVVGVGDHARQARVMVEGEQVTCSACDGRGMILTEDGKHLLMFMDTFRPTGV